MPREKGEREKRLGRKASGSNSLFGNKKRRGGREKTPNNEYGFPYIYISRTRKKGGRV